MEKEEAVTALKDYENEENHLNKLKSKFKKLQHEILLSENKLKSKKKKYISAKSFMRHYPKYVENLRQKYPHLEYVSGYKTGNRHFKVWLKDKKTEISFWVDATTLSKPNYKGLLEYVSKSHIKKSDLEKYDEYLDSLKNKNKPILFYPCKECGRAFESKWGKQFCSTKCKNRWRNHLAEVKKSNRTKIAKKNGKYDNSISLEKLFARDKGICYICGKHLDLNAYYNYPSAPTIEHVIPIIKGGTHTWDNVKLACRQCNSKKGSKLSKEYIVKAS